MVQAQPQQRRTVALEYLSCQDREFGNTAFAKRDQAFQAAPSRSSLDTLSGVHHLDQVDIEQTVVFKMMQVVDGTHGGYDLLARQRAVVARAEVFQTAAQIDDVTRLGSRLALLADLRPNCNPYEDKDSQNPTDNFYG